MTYYHLNKQAAENTARDLEKNDPRIAYCQVEFEPYNGFVVVAVPEVIDITDLGAAAEVRHPNGTRITAPPADRRRGPPLAARKPPKAASPRPKIEVVELAGADQLPRPWERSGPAKIAPSVKKPWE